MRISDLNAFIQYHLEFFDSDLDNIAWKFKHHTYQVLVDPNQYKKVEVPILVLGEVSGMVSLQQENNRKGQGRITLQIVDKNGTKVAETMSESDGYFSYLGLKPGDYTVKIDEQQLKKLNYEASPAAHAFSIQPSEEGTVIEGVTFEIKPSIIIEPKVRSVDLEKVDSIPPKETYTAKGVVDPSFGKISDVEGHFYTVQIGEFNQHRSAKELKIRSTIFYEVLANGNVRYFYGTFDTKAAAFNAKNGLLFRGIKGAVVMEYQNGFRIENDMPTALPIEETRAVEDRSKPLPKTMNTAFTNIAEVEGLVYSVQIGAYKNTVTPKQLLNLSPIYYEILPNAIVRYMYGSFSTKVAAVKARNKMIQLGINDAFMVSYKDGKKVKVSKRVD